MKLTNWFLLAALMGALFFSCNKKDDDLPEELENSILLEINPEFNSYVHENGNHFYSNAFNSKNDTTVYRLRVESGVNYHIYCLQKTVMVSPIEMILFNQEMDTITWSSHAQDSHKIFYQSNKTGEVYLKVFIKGPVTESLVYDLYFEAIKSKAFNFAGYNWEATGLWVKESDHTVKFMCNNSLKYRWIRLNEDFQNSPEISFTVKSIGINEFNPVGFVIAGSTSLLKWGDYQEELPDDGYFFNLTSENQYSVFDMQGDGISFSYGEFDIPGLDLKKGIHFRISYYTESHSPHYALYINDVHVKGFSKTYVQKFYLVVDDKGSGEVVFENVKVE